MIHPIAGEGTPLASRVEITNGIQNGPAKIYHQHGTRLDYTDAGRMKFWVELVGCDDSRMALTDSASYESAIVDAEESARDWGVHVLDLVA